MAPIEALVLRLTLSFCSLKAKKKKEKKKKYPMAKQSE